MIEINLALVRKLVKEQFPQWSSLPIYPVEPGGNDNKTFRLGSEMSVRLPSAQRYAAQVEKENTWLPFLGQHIHLPISAPIAQGKPNDDFPWNWSVCKWLEGETASKERIKDMKQFANDLAQFLKELQSIDCSNGPLAGAHNFYRGGSLSVYDLETRQAVEQQQNVFDELTLLGIWNKALETQWTKEPVWVHGDIAPGNLLVDKNGRLCAVIDFGILGVGDPACDLAIAWTFFDNESRQVFKESLSLDQGTWDRARGWAFWKTLITLVQSRNDKELTTELGKIMDAIITSK